MHHPNAPQHKNTDPAVRPSARPIHRTRGNTSNHFQGKTCTKQSAMENHASLTQTKSTDGQQKAVLAYSYNQSDPGHRWHPDPLLPKHPPTDQNPQRSPNVQKQVGNEKKTTERKKKRNLRPPPILPSHCPLHSSPADTRRTGDREQLHSRRQRRPNHGLLLQSVSVFYFAERRLYCRLPQEFKCQSSRPALRFALLYYTGPSRIHS